MATNSIISVLTSLRRLTATQDFADLSDGELLRRFLTNHDSGAFEVIVRRHGPMVFCVCRRILGDEHAAEDAFQATFLVLVRKAAEFGSREVVGDWLHGVACRTAIKARASIAFRRSKELMAARLETFEGEKPGELEAVLDEELARLPDKYRLPLILCDMEEKTRDDAARELGWPPGTVAGRLARARVLLAQRLKERGIVVSATLIAATLSHGTASAAVPTTFVMSTVKAASLFANGQAITGVASNNAVALADRVLNTMFWTKVKGMLGVLLAFTFVAVATAALTYHGSQSRPPVKAPEPEANNLGSNAPKNALPSKSIARLGTTALRHGEAINFVAFPPDGRTVLTAGDDNSIRLWDLKTGNQIHRIDGPPPPQYARVRPGSSNAFGRGYSQVAISSDGKLVAIAQHGKTVQICSLETGKEIRTFKTPTRVVAILFSPDNKTLAMRDNSRNTYLYDAAAGTLRHELKADLPGETVGISLGSGGGAISSFAFSPDGKIIATSEVAFHVTFVTMYVKITDTGTGKEIRRIETKASSASAIAYSPDGKLLAIGVDDGVSIRDTGSSKELHLVKCPHPAAELVFSPDSKQLAVKGRDSLVRLVDVKSGKTLHELGEAVPLNPKAARSIFDASERRDLAFSADGKLVSVGGAKTLRTWDTSTGKEHPLAKGHRTTVSAVGLLPDGKVMFTRSFDRTIRRWDVARSEETSRFTEPPGTTGAVFSSDGKLAALANDDGSVHLLSADTGKLLHKLKGHPTGINQTWSGVAALAFSRDGKTLASRGGADGTICLYDVVRGFELRRVVLHGSDTPGGTAFIAVGRANFADGGLGIAFAPDGQTLAAVLPAMEVHKFGGGLTVGNATTTVRILDVARGKEVGVITLPPGRYVHGIAYSPDGRIIATENTDQTVSLLEVAGRQQRALLGTPVATPKSERFVHSHNPIAPGGPILRVPLGQVSLAFSADGAFVATRGDKKVRIFDVATEREVDALLGHEGAVTSIAFSEDGKHVAAGGSDTSAWIWDVAQLKRDPADLQTKELDVIWDDLLGDDAVKAAAGIRKLALSPKQVVPYMRAHLKPVTPVDPKRIDEWLADLDSPSFAKRTKANQELERLGDLAMPGIQRALAANPSVETRRRVESLRDKLINPALTPESVRILRAIEALEMMGNAEARSLLETLAQGAAGALTTRQAQAALGRLKH